MKIELDSIRAYYAQKYNSVGKGIGKGDKVARAVVSAWVDSNRPLVVIWGPPGSGKSYALSGMDTEGSMVLETTGMNATMNKFLLGLNRKLVKFVRHTAPRSICVYRVMTRTNNPLSGIEGDDTDKMVDLVNHWFIKAQEALPVDKESQCQDL